MIHLHFDDAGRNRINVLPDDILLHILSFMPIKQAVTTSVLSRNWQHLWKSSFKKRLKFDDNDIFGPRILTSEDPTIFANLVNHVMDQYQGSTVDRLNIFYHHSIKSDIHGDVLSRWISFAQTKKVIELSLNTWPQQECTFPAVDDQLSSSSCFKHVSLSRFWPGGHILQIFKSVITLRLCYVKIKPSDFESIFSTCLSLEQLRLSHIYGLENARIEGSSQTLKHLEIYNFKYSELELKAPELRQLTCHNGLSGLKIRAPKLEGISVTLPYRKFENRVKDIFGYFYNDLSQLHTISLEIFPHEVQFTTLPIFPKLKTLILKVVRFREKSYLAFARLLKASPHLRQFKLHLLEPSKEEKAPEALFLQDLNLRPQVNNKHFKRKDSNTYNKEVETDDGKFAWTHTSLEEVYVGGFCGHECELVLLNYLIKTCTSLKTVTLKPYKPYSHQSLYKSMEKETESAYLDAQTHARQFGKDARAGIEVVVL